MKKPLLIILSIILIVSAAVGCTAVSQNANEATVTSSTIFETELSADAVIVTKANEEGVTSTSTTVKKQTSSTPETSTTAKPAEKQATSKAQTKKHKTTKKQTSTSSSKPTEKKKKRKKHSETTAKETEPSTHSESENVCYITIECKSILDNMSKLKEGHESFVPDNGIILERTKCILTKNNTAFDVLASACNSKGIKLTSRNTIYGIYVSGINNLDEFDCGSASGWVYTVNTKSPNKSCGKYAVSKGDEIVFKYVC